jgi:hypothetical protein
MLTKLTIRNFKRFGEVEIELGNPVVFIGPNNSGKTTALQALALWELGLRRWRENSKNHQPPKSKLKLTVNRLDLAALPVPSALQLWRDLLVHVGSKAPYLPNVKIEILVEGVFSAFTWRCGFEFYYANEESLYCGPMDLQSDSQPVPPENEMGKCQVAFLPPMSGLAANEILLPEGAINTRIGEGRTAEVLRNLCWRISSQSPGEWAKVVEHIRSMFGCELDEPREIPERGEIVMSYREARKNNSLDLSSSGKGLQQTLLLLAYLYSKPGAILLLDEPDAHLEIIRQRQTYQLLSDVARENGSQLIVASHSEVILNEAAGRDTVVAFVGKPHCINDRGSQVLKSLKEIRWEDYSQAEQTGWVLYLEGSTDLAILRALAERLGHQEAIQVLARPFVHYVGNEPGDVKRHFHGLREAYPELLGVALFDRLDKKLPDDLGATGLTWRRREIENYLCYPETLEAFALATPETGPPGSILIQQRLEAMRKSIEEVEDALSKLRKGSAWDYDTKVSSDALPPLFAEYYRKLNLPNLMAKKNFHVLAQYVPVEKIDPEVMEKLDAIVEVAGKAKPLRADDK